MLVRSWRSQMFLTQGGDLHPAPAQLIGNPQLPPGGLLDGQFDHGRLDRRVDAVLGVRLAPGELLEGDLAALLVKLLEAVEAVPAVAHHLAGLADAAELLGQLQQPHLAADHLLLAGHRDLRPEDAAGPNQRVRRPPLHPRLSNQVDTVAP
jgi:hypothetical protein